MEVYRITLVTYLVVITVSVATQYSDKDCGRSFVGHRQPRRNETDFNEARIINGKRSLKGAWPWQVSLQLLHPKFGLIGHWCGAVLIRPLWIITAAHCIHNDLFNLPLATLWTAVLGDWNRDEEENTEIRVPIDRIIVHEKFDNYQNDIAIMKLSRPVKIRTVCLPGDTFKYSQHHDEFKSIKLKQNRRKGRTNGADSKSTNNVDNRNTYANSLEYLKAQIQKISEQFKNNKKTQKTNISYKSITPAKCVVTGWGRYRTQGSMTSTLLQATVPIHNNSLCQAKYGNMIPIKTGHLCAGHLDGTTGTCVGDSGGPLQCSLSDGRWVLAGITSFGSGCAKPGYPDVYTRLTFYVSWINQQINKYQD